MESLEKKFKADMQNIYKIAKKELGYNATRFLQLISVKGELNAAKIRISKDGGTYNFILLKEKKLFMEDINILQDKQFTN